MARDFEDIRDLDDLNDDEMRQLVRERIAEHTGLDPDDITVRVEAGQVVPSIDRTYPLLEAREAVRYVEEGHARGKVVIVV